MATILDVARLAGVSQGTVSNVLNRKGNVSSKKIRLEQFLTSLMLLFLDLFKITEAAAFYCTGKYFLK